MTKVIGVKFKENGKSYYFNPKDFNIKENDNVIVETVRGLEFGNVVFADREINEEELSTPLKDVVRVATKADVEKHEANIEKAKEAIGLCEEKVKKHKLDMKLIDAEYTFDNSKIIFYFSAEGRIDFRELVKDLATIFRTRIELRQIGVRDEAKLLGGLGHCGREFCCHKFLCDFQPVSIKMAKDQGLSLNPTKISGACGRLMCCLSYEQQAYEEKIKRVPKVGAVVSTPLGEGTVMNVNILKEKVQVKLTSQNDTVNLEEFEAKDVKIIKNNNNTKEEDIEAIEELKNLED
ncbi:MAG: stage 0 sporulation protein [Clostridiales bacterium]|nr:stage 0 sporulation protein [Clostridiales bacterium]